MQKNSIVPFIRNQFPQHISDTETLLIPFMEAYYEWMNSTNNIYDITNSLSELYNIDESLSKFSEQFTEEYLSHFPSDIVTDKALTIKHINDLYKAKGTPAATKLLIKLILGKDSEIFYPSSQILRASDGEWVQENSILVEVLSGNIFDIVGQSVRLSTTGIAFNSVVERVKITQTSNIYEVFLEKKLVYNISDNTILSYGNVLAETRKTLTEYRVLSAGSGFKIGQIINVDYGDGSGTVIKVKSITAGGGIKSVQFIKFGYGYQSKFSMGINAVRTELGDVVSIFPSSVSDTVASLNDKGYLSKYDYTVIGYMDESYTGEVLSTFASTKFIKYTPNSAIIEFGLGNKLKYPGYYNSISGFLSNNIYLQDNYYYQIYSYVIKIDEVLEKYKARVESTVHPAGMKLFGDYNIKNNFQVNTRLSFILNFFRTILSETVTMQESFYKIFTKGLIDSTTMSDNAIVSLMRYATDTVSNSDLMSYIFTKFIAETLSVTDLSNFNMQKFLDDVAIITENTSINTTLIKADVINITDATLIGYFFDKYLNDTQTVADVPAIFFNYYSEPYYWQSDYSVGAI